MKSLKQILSYLMAIIMCVFLFSNINVTNVSAGERFDTDKISFKEIKPIKPPTVIGYDVELEQGHEFNEKDFGVTVISNDPRLSEDDYTITYDMGGYNKDVLGTYHCKAIVSAEGMEDVVCEFTVVVKPKSDAVPPVDCYKEITIRQGEEITAETLGLNMDKYEGCDLQIFLMSTEVGDTTASICVLKDGKYVGDSTITVHILPRENVTLEEKSLAVSSFIGSKPSPQAVKTAVTFTTKVSGTTGNVQYKYYRYLNGNYATIKDWSNSSSIKIAPSTAGKYDIYVAVKDGSGKTVRKNIAFEFKNQANLAISSFTANKTSPQAVKTEVTFTTKVSGTTGNVQYKYYRYLNGNYAIIKDWSNSSSITIAPSTAGKYDIYVAVKDSKGEIVTKAIAYEIKANLSLDVKPSITILKGNTVDVSDVVNSSSDNFGNSLSIKLGDLDTSTTGENKTLVVIGTDKYGNTKSATVKVTVADNPTINVKSNITIKQNSKVQISDIVESATDWKGNDITSKVSITGLDTSVVGTQKVTVSVTDSYGYIATKITNVKVVADTPVEKKYKVNSAEYKQIMNKEMYRLIAELRAEKGRPVVGIDSNVQELALLKNEHMIQYGYFDHTYNGKRIGDVYPDLVPNGDSGDSVLENLYLGGDSLNDQTEEEIKATALHVFNAWKGSALHYNTMVEQYVTLIGFDYTVSENGTAYATLEAYVY